jgi:hypothetical protein
MCICTGVVEVALIAAGAVIVKQKLKRMKRKAKEKEHADDGK